MHDVVVVGGGPAGLYAGARLAAAGFQTALLEEHSAVGEPVHCTGVLAADAFAEFDLPRRAWLHELTTARFWSPAGHQIAYSSPVPEAVVIDRRVFDQDLLEIARASRVAVTTGARVLGVTIDAQGVNVRATTGDLRARACVLACGASYALHKQVSLAMPRMFLHTAQLELPARQAGDVELHFGSEVAPKGFGWVVPVRRGERLSARVGVMCEGDARRHFDRLIARVAGRWQIDLRTSGAPRQKMLPLGPIPRTFSRRLVAIGDAAGLVKPTTGGGIYYSLLSAALATDVLSAALREDRLEAERLAPYERLWRARISDELEAQLSLRRLAHRMTDEEIEALFELARTDGVMPIVRRTASFNRHRHLILSLLGHPPVRRLLFRRLAC